MFRIIPSESTIVSLPSEIQLEIFKALHNSEDTQLFKQDTLRAVSQVCTRWRNLSLATSTFWTYIFVCETSVDLSIHFDDPYTVDEGYALRMFPWVSTLLLRSGIHPIDVSIDLQVENFNPTLSEAQNQSNLSWYPGHAIVLSRILAARAARLRNVEIVSEVWQPIQDLTSVFFGVAMPLLQSWTVTRNNARWGHQFTSDLELDSNMSAMECPFGIESSMELSVNMYPSLSVLTFQGVPQNWRQLIPHNLVELNLEYLPVNRRPKYEELQALLLGNQNSLQSLTLWAAAPLAGGSSKIILPNLRTLSIGFSFLDAAISLTTYLEVPRLSSLEIYDMTHQNPSNFADERSVLTTVWLLEDFYSHMINYWPLRQITQLTLRSPCFVSSDYDELEGAFARNRQDDIPLPILLNFLLHCLSLKNFHLIDPDVASFRTLTTVSPRNHQNVSGQILACSSLDLLHIETVSGTPLAIDPIFHPHVDWRCRKIHVAPRKVDTILLDVPPECGTALWSFLNAFNTAQRVLLNATRTL